MADIISNGESKYIVLPDASEVNGDVVINSGVGSLTIVAPGGKAIMARIYDRAALIPIICERIAGGDNLTAMSREDGMPDYATVQRWLRDDAEAAQEYARARELRADARADRLDDLRLRVLSGEVDPQAARVAADLEKWQAAHEAPKRYGDRLELAGEVGVKTLTDEQVDARLRLLMDRQRALPAPDPSE